MDFSKKLKEFLSGKKSRRPLSRSESDPSLRSSKELPKEMPPPLEQKSSRKKIVIVTDRNSIRNEIPKGEKYQEWYVIECINEEKAKMKIVPSWEEGDLLISKQSGLVSETGEILGEITTETGIRLADCHQSSNGLHGARVSRLGSRRYLTGVTINGYFYMRKEK